MGNSDLTQWSDTMRTGVAEIDEQHRILVDTLIEAKAKLTGGIADPLFDQITRDLLAYAIYHFDTEEGLMRLHGYATAAPEEAAAHLHQHRHFSEKVVDMRSTARAGKPGSREALVEFLQNWLVNHILTTDKRLGQFLCAITPGNDTRPAYHHD
jgi:hemerythrin-like metal-binding protein